MTNLAERAEQVRDLKGQIKELAEYDEQEIVFRPMPQPGDRRVMLYSMLDGEPIPVKIHRVEAMIEKQLPDGTPMFTAHQERAPQHRLGQVKCFLHPESPERPILNEIGLASQRCMSAHLANNFSKRIHAEHRHPQSWRAYQEYMSEMKEEQYQEQREKEVKAMQNLARAAAKGGSNGDGS